MFSILICFLLIKITLSLSPSFNRRKFISTIGITSVSQLIMIDKAYADDVGDDKGDNLYTTGTNINTNLQNTIINNKLYSYNIPDKWKSSK
jgi:hypothetical protein